VWFRSKSWRHSNMKVLRSQWSQANGVMRQKFHHSVASFTLTTMVLSQQQPATST
jgi:hypothetical protein